MKNNQNNNISLASRGIRYKLNIAYALMSVLPILISIYLVSAYILPKIGLRLDIFATLAVSVFIAVIGFFIIKEILDRVLTVSSDAKIIAAGDLSYVVPIKKGDEVGELGEALNQITQRIRNNMAELNAYSERTNKINFEIQKRVLVLSGLLQISSLISQGAKIEDALKLATEKSRFIANSDLAYLLFREEGKDFFYMRAAEGINAQPLFKLKVTAEDVIFAKLIKTNKPLIIDKDNLAASNVISALSETFKLKSTLALPVYFSGKVVGIIGIGSDQEKFVYSKDDAELLDIFSKQVAIAIENDVLMQRIEKLEIKDTLTGLYNEGYIHNRLQEEIRRAIIYKRPCAFIMLDIDNFRDFHHNFGSLQAEAVLKRVANFIKGEVSDIEPVGRTGDSEFSIVLPEKNKRQTQKIAEDIRCKIEASFSKETDINRRLTLSSGISENPIDGIRYEELVRKAKEELALDKGRKS